ncbi:MAG: 50S ribosomal protein L30 [Candidatus Thalassarchaeum sp.]|nr:50S ribosomal protein L30 [Candidatus Thalassarchaeum sp.]MEC8939086.1 50S ribosomal protein L30 [Candidatus Thermoplasmatota archaeon]MEC9351011.1 50S ribosomal protein L30 [Candidatus Thermoplasmatota archaeon]MED6312335.1 50S ribosomal protein L30 [Candidatus Thermoplasmatota archaeon]MEE3200815.1 50S ribosomal protein L30 [Candidatus Thermoplasmatota archaeon]
MTFLVVRVRSDRGVERRIRDTMAMLNLTRVNHATIVPESSTYAGMLQKSKDFVTWGVIDANTIESLLKERGRMVGNKPVDDAAIKANSEFKSMKDFAKALASGEATMKSVDGLKPVLRLHPPRGSKGWGGIKRAYSVGGALGFRGNEISSLAERMI